MSMNSPPRTETATGAKLVIYWLLVGIPLLWGVAHTLSDAVKLFH